MSPAAAARSILVKSGSTFLEPETAAACDGVATHLADPRGALLLPVARDGFLAIEVAHREEVPAIALVVDVPSGHVGRRALPRLRLTGWLSETSAPVWLAAGGRALRESEVVLHLDPQIVVLVTDHGDVDVDLDDYQSVPAKALPVRARAGSHNLTNDDH